MDKYYRSDVKLGGQSWPLERANKGMDLADYSTGLARLKVLGMEFLMDNAWSDTIPTAAYLTPKDAGKKTALARLLIRSVFGGRGIIFGITEHGIWPCCGNESLFLRYRASFSEDLSINDAPFHFATANEAEYVEGMLALSLYFIWGIVIASETDNVFARTSHDEWLEVAARSPDRLADLCAMLDEFEMERI